MEVSKYQEIAYRSHNTELNQYEALTCYNLRMASAIGNISAIAQSQMFNGIDIDKELIVEELSEVLINASNLASVLDIKLDTVAGYGVNTIMMNKPGQPINAVNDIQVGDTVSYAGTNYIVEAILINKLLISNDDDDFEVSIQDVIKVNH